MGEIVNTMASGATSQTTSILSGPAGWYIYFGLAVLLIWIGYSVFKWFAGKSN